MNTLKTSFRHSLRGRLMLSIGLPLLLLNGLLIGMEYQLGKQEAIEGMQAYLREMAQQHAESINSDFSAIAQVARSAAWFLGSVDPTDDAALRQGLEGNLQLQPLIYGSAIAFAPEVRRAAPYVFRRPGVGQPGFMDIGRDAYDYTGRDWYRLPMARSESRWSEPYFDEGAGNVLMVTYSALLPSPDRLRGVLTVDVSLKDLDPKWAEIWGGYAAIISREGAYLVHPQAELLRKETLFATAARLGVPELAQAGREMQAGKGGLLRLADPLDGEGHSWLVFAPIPSTGWSLMAVVDEAKVLAGVMSQLQRQLLWSLLGMGLLLVILALVAARLTQPLVQLSRAALAVGEGDFDVRVPRLPGGGEISQFGLIFNRMLDELKEAMAARLKEVASRQAVESELNVAREIQRSLLPHVFPPFPDHAEFDLHGLCDPAMTMSGDFYDYFLLDSGTLVLVLADVCGKGLPAAMFMAVARTTLRNYSHPQRSPAQTLEAVNQALNAGNEQCMFVTVFYAHYELATGRLRYVCAGHPPPCLIHPDGKVEYLEGAGSLLAAFAHVRYETREISLAPGEVMLVYTDGVTEAEGATEGQFGEEGLANWLGGRAAQPVDEMCRELAAEVEAYRRNERQDDITLLALRRNPVAVES